MENWLKYFGENYFKIKCIRSCNNILIKIWIIHTNEKMGWGFIADIGVHEMIVALVRVVSSVSLPEDTKNCRGYFFYPVILYVRSYKLNPLVPNRKVIFWMEICFYDFFYNRNSIGNIIFRQKSQVYYIFKDFIP